MTRFVRATKRLQRNRQRIALRGHHHAQLATRLSAALHARHLLDVAQAQRPAAGLAVTADGDDVARRFAVRVKTTDPSAAGT